MLSLLAFLDKNFKYVIYGADAYGEIALAGLRANGLEPEYFLDRKLAGQTLGGVNVFSPSKDNIKPEYCYVVAAGGAYTEICDLLRGNGCNNLMNLSCFFDMDLEDTNFSGRAKEFWFNKHLYEGLIHKPASGEIYIPHVDFCTTEFCSLKCRNCSQLIPYYPDPQNINLEYSLACFDRFLATVDFVTEVRVLGGEPFCNKETYKVIEHLHNHAKIGQIVIYTNGTIIPGERILKDLNDGMAIVHVSDYGASKMKLDDLVKTFKKYPKIKYFVRSYDNWMDLGNISLRTFTESRLKEVYDSCNQRSCRHFHNDRFYSCPRVASLYQMGICGMENEWVDFSNKVESLSNYRILLKRLLSRETPYEACSRCNGSLYAKSIPAAEQII